MTPEDQSRSEFEAHMRSMGVTSLTRLSESLGGHYRSLKAHQAWLTWQASRSTYRASVLEEAQLVCEDIADEYGDREGGKWPELKSDAQSGAKACENALRALAAKTQEGQ